MVLNHLELALPSTFSLLTNEKLRVFFIQQWEQSYQMRGTTYDEWFTEIGYTLLLPKESPPDHDKLRRFRLPTWPLTLQEHYELQVLEDQQRREQRDKKDTIKLVKKRNARSDAEDSPGRLTRGLAYATHNRHKYPSIQNAFDHWVNNDTSMEFEEHFHKNVL